jgi:hypothetical protein
VLPNACPFPSWTMNDSVCSSIVQGGGKRRVEGMGHQLSYDCRSWLSQGAMQAKTALNLCISSDDLAFNSSIGIWIFHME